MSYTNVLQFDRERNNFT